VPARRHVELLREWGVEVQILDTQQVRELAPYLETSDVALAWYQPNAGYASSTATAFSFAERAQQLGAEVREHVEVTGIGEAAGRVTGVTVRDGSTIEAPIVFLAGGAWALPLLRSIGLDLPVIAARTQVAHLRWPSGAEPIRFVNISDYILGSYFAWHGDDARSVVIGLSADKRQPIDDLDHFNEEGDAAYAATAHERMRARIPAAAYIRRDVGWAGPVTITPDRATIIDEHPGMRGLFYVTGCNGRGFKGAPALGRALAEWAVDGRPATLDLAPFSARRFETGQGFASAVEYHDRRAEFQAVSRR
jgi:sarcosine oxidase subunit beta